MEKQQSPWQRPLVIYLLVEIVIFVVIGVIWWFGGKHSVERFTTVSFFSGVVIMVVGGLPLLGSRGTTGSFRYQYAQTTNPDDMHDRIFRDWKERFANEGQLLILIGIGLVPILVGILVSKIWG